LDGEEDVTAAETSFSEPARSKQSRQRGTRQNKAENDLKASSEVSPGKKSKCEDKRMQISPTSMGIDVTKDQNLKEKSKKMVRILDARLLSCIAVRALPAYYIFNYSRL
jgi:hypothetical protein